MCQFILVTSSLSGIPESFRHVRVTRNTRQDIVTFDPFARSDFRLSLGTVAIKAKNEQLRSFSVSLYPDGQLGISLQAA